MARGKRKQTQLTFAARKSSRIDNQKSRYLDSVRINPSQGSALTAQRPEATFIESPVPVLQIEPAPIYSATNQELIGLPSPYAHQPRGGSKFSPSGLGSRNSTILRANMPVSYIGKRPRRPVSNRKMAIPRYMGRGDYASTMQAFKRGLSAAGRTIRRVTPVGTFGRVGSAIGGAMSQNPLGAMAGGAAGNLFSKLVGFGDYNVVANSLSKTSEKLNMGMPVAAFGNISNGTVVQHREYIQDVVGTGSTAFSLSEFNINPGLNNTFPWLSFLAANYEQYEIRGMVFEYKSLCSDQTAGAASALGSVILATDYDSIDSNYASKAEMEQSQYCTSGKPSNDIIHPVECAPNRTSIPINYIRSTAQPAGTDIRLYDLGKFQLALAGIPAATAPAASLLGELWVTYEIVLYKPQVSNVSFFYQADHFNLGATWASPAQSTGFGTTAAIAIAKTAESGSNLGWTITGVNELTCPRTLPIGRYLMNIKWLGASTALVTALVVTFGTGLTQLAIQNGNTAGASNAAAGETAVQQWVTVTFQVVSLLTTTSTITISAGTLPGTPAAGDIFIIRLPGTLD